MRISDLFNRRTNSAKKPSLKQKTSSMKCRKICYSDTDFSELEAAMKSDSKAILSLTPVNYYAVKNQYIMAHIYTSEEFSENYVKFQRFDYERKTNESEIFSIDYDILSKVLAKVGIII